MCRRQISGGSWTPVERITYDYYGASDPNGSVNDLKSASQANAQWLGRMEHVVAVTYYRYWMAGSSTQVSLHGLKMRFWAGSLPWLDVQLRHQSGDRR